MSILGLKKLLLPLLAAIALACSMGTALAKDDLAGNPDDDSPDLIRKTLWTGSFDTAGDAVHNVEVRLNNDITSVDCAALYKNPVGTDGKPLTPGPDADKNYQKCLQAQQQATGFAAEATSIRKQQRVMSDISKVSDIAAVGAIGATAYEELLGKNQSQPDTLTSAADIEHTAGLASYATGATDFAMGAYAYLGQKSKLEDMQTALKADGNKQVNSSITSAVDATKSAAYSHMMYGAGKLAVGYGMMYLEQKNRQAAANLNSIDMEQYMAAQSGVNPMGVAPATAYVQAGPLTPPYYTSNAPIITMPQGTATAASSPATPLSAAGSGTGGFTPFLSNRALASGTGASRPLSGAGISAGGGAPPAAANSADPAAGPAAPNAVKDGTAKEALGNSFEMSLTGGTHSYNGSGSAAGKDDAPNLGGLLGLGGNDAAKAANTNISPNQLYRAAMEGSDGSEEGSLSGVNGGNDATLFDIMKSKLTKMAQTGQVGMPRNVDVR